MYNIFIKLISLFALLTLSHFATSQIVNMDREIQLDSAGKKGYVIAATSLSTNRQKSNLWTISSKLEASRYLKNKYMLLGLAKGDFVYNGKISLQNEGMFHLRYRDMDTRMVSQELFSQYQWNGSWGMVSRRIVGGNIRFRFMENKKADLYTATGLFKEWETWNWSGVKELPKPVGQDEFNRNMFRLNQYIKYAIKLNDVVDVSAVSFFQFPLQGQFLNARWSMDANMNLQVSRKVSVTIKWNHTFDNNRIVPIDNFNYHFETGFQYDW